MNRLITYLILTVCTNSICFAQSNLGKFQNDCYSINIQLNINEKIFKDTVIMVRNYIEKIDEKRIICNDLIVENEIHKMIWECEYIKSYLTYQNKMNKFSLLLCRLDSQKNIIAFYFLSDRKTKKTVEMTRFKIANNKIVGINILPNIYEGFVPIDEFDNHNAYMIDL